MFYTAQQQAEATLNAVLPLRKCVGGVGCAAGYWRNHMAWIRDGKPAHHPDNSED